MGDARLQLTEGKVANNIVPPALRWQVWVDWAGDGSWAPDSADVSADVLGLHWRWGEARVAGSRVRSAGPTGADLQER